ncbi:hypothetical protein KAFR_0E00950 [Kazachstania africana CBS 2517]|uniref:VPS9 domain-containing protein n=1 Tax=Kazachstania africana (strain ATCC 22294 / BCRC 22015 / CBS 2517 / CECT 1963 / NBRC 1671 / NRRL Y-8276) TaxID=1071382 RepID=H2AV49_KAZAF|nr:hypothetical protein KAFR_0E00950 [Kazachstania africana CBS 2517]CCF58249.1 hypothetical protein KAFR_0E00950 [Kazachstania africana CBS 2517]
MKLFTPPITNPNFDPAQSIRESYGVKAVFQKPVIVQNESEPFKMLTASNSGKNDYKEGPSTNTSGVVKLTKEEIAEIWKNTQELPMELSSMIDDFITDLKEPKYAKPLSIVELSSLFQAFYIKFDKFAFQYLSNGGSSAAGAPTNTSSGGTFFNAKETLSSGLSGIFARSRSGSNTNNLRGRRNRRSSSLFSSDSNNNATQMLTPEEIGQMMRVNEINNVTIDRYLELCENAIFKKLLQVGTAVSSPMKKPNSNNNIQCINNENSLVGQSSSEPEAFNVENLFRNTPEYIQYNTLLNVKLGGILNLCSHDKFSLEDFLGISMTMDIGDNESLFATIDSVFHQLIDESISPYDKMKSVLQLHTAMTTDIKLMSNDDYLSLLIYYIIMLNPQNLFFNCEYIKLFRYRKKLVENELYALTNLDAALTFIGSLTLEDFSEDLVAELAECEKKVFECKISDKVTLPVVDTNNFRNGSNGSSKLLHTSTEPMIQNNSYERFRAVFDSSLRSVLGKMRSYTPPAVTTLYKKYSQTSIEIERSSVYSNSSHDKYLHVQRSNSNNKHRQMDSINSILFNATMPNDWKKYKDSEFDNLKITELKEIFDIYQKLISKNEQCSNYNL